MLLEVQIVKSSSETVSGFIYRLEKGHPHSRKLSGNKDYPPKNILVNYSLRILRDPESISILSLTNT